MQKDHQKGKYTQKSAPEKFGGKIIFSTSFLGKIGVKKKINEIKGYRICLEKVFRVLDRTSKVCNYNKIAAKSIPESSKIPNFEKEFQIDDKFCSKLTKNCKTAQISLAQTSLLAIAKLFY